MSFLPGEKLRYAETHFKFKLPWSLLYKPWPEIIFDAPFQFVPGVEPMLWIVVRDADRFPTTIKNAEIVLKVRAEDAQPQDSQIKNAQQSGIVIRKDLNIEVHEQMKFIPIALGKIPASTYEAHCKLTVERNGKTQTFERWNLPRLKPVPLRFKVLNEELPIALGYAAGEMHCHTYYSADHVEYGATPEVLQQAAKAVGLDFVSCTDHAYDFAFTQEDFTKEADSPVPRFQKLREEIAALPKTDENGNRLPLMIAGEEVSAGNSKGENVHMTVLGPEGYLPGLGDCGRYWLENRPTRSIKQILNMTEAHCFAAHPFQQMGLLEKFVFRRGYWKPEDLNIKGYHSIRGLQFWNGIRDEGFKLGREFWINELGKGNYLLPIGGNDAHGDLNSMTAVSLPLISLKHTRAHIFGNVRTVIKVGSRKLEVGSEAKQESPLSLDAINAAFAADNCYITDGPALWWERDDNGITFHARSNKEMGGGFRYIRIYGRRELPNGKLAPTEEIMLGSLIAAPDHADIPVATFGFAYVRAECETATGKFALTSAAQIF
ncbi:PHP domain-containing protein [Fibrobacter succinogenes]|uniref:PHP domain-containing protein n=1 Tax=Fibrobacter succinogenes TaxID=833 RepID=UPI001568DEE8|nr:PHP domain-containing protein [Fibrobacter succinogenes]